MNQPSHRILIENARLFSPSGEWQPGWLLTEGRSIRAMGPGHPPAYPDGHIMRRIDAARNILLPGFIDLHVHGAVGHDTMDASPDGLRAMARFYARHGVTAFLATTWTATRADILAALQAVAQVRGTVQAGATLLGAHLEGPYLNPEKCGAQDVRLIRRVDPAEVNEFLGTGLVRLVALAPEFPENLWLVEECARRGITSSAAHTAATYAQMQAAVGRGLAHVTHTYNAMTGLGHRELGTLGAAMALPQLACELIADNVHVHPGAMQILAAVKEHHNVILVTDAIRGAGLQDGEYHIGDRTIRVRDGAARLPDGTLAGSILTMDLALKNFLEAARMPLRDAWQSASLNAARAIGLSARKGSLEAGKDADLALLDSDFNVLLTVAEGEIVFARDGMAL